MKKNKPERDTSEVVRTIRAFLPLLLLVILIVGCGGPQQVPTTFHKQETKISKKARDAYENGRYDKALAFYKEALKASRAVEDIDLTAVNLINIAVVYRQMGEIESAQKTVDEILKAAHVAYRPERMAEAALIKALLYHDAGDWASSKEWAARSIKLCPAPECGQMGRAYNLKASLALKEGGITEAITLGNQGLKWNREHRDLPETANSLRVIAKATTEGKNFSEARTMYDEALAIDKELGLSRKIALDLMGLGHLYLKQGNNQEALKYFQRALSVSVGGEDQEGVKQASAMVRMVEERLKPPQRPTK